MLRKQKTGTRNTFFNNWEWEEKRKRDIIVNLKISQLKIYLYTICFTTIVLIYYYTTLIYRYCFKFSKSLKSIEYFNWTFKYAIVSLLNATSKFMQLIFYNIKTNSFSLYLQSTNNTHFHQIRQEILKFLLFLQNGQRR